MKFIITSGKKKGAVFEIVDDEITIGRSKDNRVVLDDEGISGRHARLYMEGNRVFVEDCDSINGIAVNGETVKKAPIHKGDLLSIGVIKIEALGDREEEDPKRKNPEDQEDSRPDRPSGRPSNHQPSPVFKIILAAVLVLAVIGLAAFLYLKQKSGMASPSSGLAVAGFANNVFRLYYEKVRASNENIFRYEMRIENNAISISIDDLKQNRHLRQSKSITTNQVAFIRDAIHDQQLFSLPPQMEGKSKDIWDSDAIRVVTRGKTANVQVLNSVPPENFKKVCAILENFGETELGIVALSMSLEELKKRADDAHQRARKLYDERFVKMENLFNSIKAWSEVIWYLDTIDPKPGIYADAIHRKEEASEELEKQLGDHWFRATRASQLKDWKTARDEFNCILQKMPDATHKRNQDAKMRLLDVEQRLQPK